MRIECPSSLVITARKLKTKEIDILANNQASRKGVQFDNMLASVTESVEDTGPYQLNDKTGKLDWGDVLVGDRMYAQIQLRAATFGSEYSFGHRCSSCRESYNWVIDLLDLPVKTMEPEDLETFVNGNRFNITMDTGFSYTFQLLTGKTSRKAAEMVKGQPQSRITASLGARILELRDPDGSEVLAKRQHLENLELSDMYALLEAMDAHDCGVETTIDVECPHCGYMEGVEIPFDRKEFWVPPRMRKTTRGS